MRWQHSLLPFMVGSIVFMGLFFFLASLAHLYYLHEKVAHERIDLQAAFEDYERSVEASDDMRGLAYLRWKTAALLEGDAIARRYHQANSAMLARVWTRYLGFLTGVILALTGAVFILGKLREESSQLGVEGQGYKATLNTSSPGLMLALLGSILIAITLVVPFKIGTRDVPLYLTGGVDRAGTLPQPSPWPGADAGVQDAMDAVKKETELFPEAMP